MLEKSQRCTFEKGSRGKIQKMYQCRTCGIIRDMGICEACARRCHKGHDIIEIPTEKLFNCDCGQECGKNACQCCDGRGVCVKKRLGTNLAECHVYCCKTCGMKDDVGICNVCAERCHQGHNLVDKGVWYEFTCSCGTTRTGAKCVAKTPPEPEEQRKKEFLSTRYNLDEMDIPERVRK